MSEPFLGEIRIVGFSFPPRGWANCDGQLLSIAQNNALFALFGAMYGGDAETSFGLPDLRSRLPMHTGQGPGLSYRPQGQKGGAENTNLTAAQMPNHTHTGTVVTSTEEGDRNDPAGAYMARPEDPLQPYGGSSGGTMAAGSVQIGSAGSSQGFTNLPPYQVLRFVVALVGIFPSQN